MALDKIYNPKDVEKKQYKFWMDNKCFAASEESKKDPYCIVIPPPNITGALHMGHALNNTLQDILIRWRRMQGYESLWQPGTDHAGIATQNVVEKEILNKEGKTRHEVGREALIKRIWEWREQYGNRIIGQLQAIGSSCDWDRLRFTLDEGLSKAVRENFVKLYSDGLIYKGKYIVNWCPRCRTALADDEVEHEDHKGHLWHISYPLADGSGEVVVATTRPETMLGDTAVAVNPKDERYQGMIGKMLKLPETNREIPIVADDFVDQSFGTGAVKVTPAHDPNDFQMGLRHNMEKINVMNEDAVMNRLAGVDYEGMDRYECREALVEALTQKKLLKKIEEHQHAVGHCYRCHTVIEPYLSDQWFVKMQPLAKKAIEATKKGKVKFHPERWTDFYLQWLENVRDWCISRQIWWGHRIPVWYCENKDCKPIVTKENPNKCPKCGSSKLRQDEDVLDTWFSSALWPFSTLGWPDKTKALKKFYPTSVLSTDRGIIFFWVARMVMMGLYDMKDVPFRDVYIHGTILDEKGRKMSKSLGNGIDPIDIIDKYGADAMRFSLISLSAEGQDIKLSEQKFEMGRNFCNKIWNAARFAMMNLEDYDGKEDKEKNLSKPDKWIYHRYQIAANVINDALENFKFNDAATAIYKFIWNEFCDWYLELIKPIMSKDASRDQRHATQWNLARVFDGILRLAHPVMPFITEEIWQQLKGMTLANEKTLMHIAYPENTKKPEFADEAQKFELVKDMIDAIRNIRGEHDVKPGQLIEAKVLVKDKTVLASLTENQSYLMKQAKLSKVEFLDSIDKKIPAATALVGSSEIFIPFAGMIDINAEKERLTKEIAKAEGEYEMLNKKLSNEGFVNRAPKDVVEKERARLTEVKSKLAKLKESLDKLT